MAHQNVTLNAIDDVKAGDGGDSKGPNSFGKTDRMHRRPGVDTYSLLVELMMPVKVPDDAARLFRLSDGLSLVELAAVKRVERIFFKLVTPIDRTGDVRRALLPRRIIFSPDATHDSVDAKDSMLVRERVGLPPFIRIYGPIYTVSHVLSNGISLYFSRLLTVRRA